MREFFEKHLWLYRVYLCLVVVPIVTPIFLVETIWNSVREAAREFWYVWESTISYYKHQIETMWREGADGDD